MNDEQRARLDVIVARETERSDERLWGGTRRAFADFIFPSAFRTALRQVVRPTFEAFVKDYMGRPTRAYWRPRLEHPVFSGEEAMNQPVGYLDYDSLIFTFDWGVVQSDHNFDPRLVIRADKDRKKVVAHTSFGFNDSQEAEAFDLAELTVDRLNDLILDSFDATTQKRFAEDERHKLPFA